MEKETVFSIKYLVKSFPSTANNGTLQNFGLKITPEQHFVYLKISTKQTFNAVTWISEACSLSFPQINTSVACKHKPGRNLQ